MTEDTERTRDRFDLSLDGRQIASIVVGALVILGVVFVLGLNVGRQLAAREFAAAGGDALAALEQPPVPPAEPLRDDELTYGKVLTDTRPAPIAVAAAAPPPAPAPSAPPSSSEPDPVLAPAQAPAAARPAAEPALAVAAAPAAPPKPAATTPSFTATPSGDWTVQVGSAQDRAEATRLAKRFERWNPRIETADLGAKGRWYRVRLGRYETREAAERFLRDLQRETGAKGYVTSAK